MYNWLTRLLDVYPDEFLGFGIIEFHIIFYRLYKYSKNKWNVQYVNLQTFLPYYVNIFFYFERVKFFLLFLFILFILFIKE
jgi:hypothetical protein